MTDKVNPEYYGKHPANIECITVAEHMNFNMGNALKYIWRADGKGDPIGDLRKAAWYIERELKRRLAADDVVAETFGDVRKPESFGEYWATTSHPPGNAR